MKKLLIILSLVILVSGCGSVEETAKEPEVTADVVADIPEPKEPVKSYEFSILGKEEYVDELCAITSRVKNIDDVSHRYHLTSYVIIGNTREEMGEEFNLGAGKIKTVTREIRCPVGTENTINSEVKQVE